MKRSYLALLFVPAIALAGCKKTQPDVSENLAKAAQFEKDGNDAKARVELQNALQAAPTNPQANFSLGKLEEEAGNLNEAVRYYVRAATPEAHLLDAQLKLESILIDAGRIPDALAQINFTLGSFPNDPTAIAMRADAAERLGDLQKAETDASTALRQDPSNARASAVLAKLKLRNSAGQEALALVDRALGKHPDDLRLLQVRAATLLTLDQPAKAVEALETIIRSSPNNVSAVRALADLQASQGHFDEAFQTFKTTTEADPSNQPLQLSLVDFLVAQNRPTEVVSYLDGLIQKSPGENIYDLALSAFYQRAGQADRAEMVLDNALKRLGDSPAALDIRLSRADLATQRGDVSAAAAELDAVLKVAPQNERALLAKSAVLLQNGQPDNAITNLLAVVRSNPVSARGFELLAAAYTVKGENKLGIDAMRRVTAVTPGDADAELRLATFLQNAGAAAESREIMSRLTLRYPNSVVVWIRNAQLAVARKDTLATSLSVTRLRSIPGAGNIAAMLDAQIKLARGDTDGGLSGLRSLIDTDPNVDPALILAFTKSSIAGGQTAQAAQYLEGRANALTGDAAKAAWTSLMTLWVQLGQDSKAQAAFRKLAAASPGSPDPYQQFAQILVDASKVPQAKSVVDAGIAAVSDKWALLMLRGSIGEKQNDYTAALESYQQAVKQNPLSLDALNNYASILADHDPKNVAALQDVLSRLAPNAATTDPDVADTLAWVNYRLGHFDVAKALLTRIDAGASSNPQMRFHLGAVLIASGDKAEGLKLLDTVKDKTFPGSDEVQSLSAT